MQFTRSIVASALALSAGLLGTTDAHAEVGRQAKVQIAILLDTSSSMDGLIVQAKSELWTIVNRFSESKFKGQDTRLEVALYEYGKASIAKQEGYLRQVTPFTSELDEVSESLFALQTNGGDEYAGLVIDSSVSGLSWSPVATDYKAIFIAGNESFAQGPVPYQKAVSRAGGKGIIVNTIFCGAARDRVATSWQHAAKVGEGSFLAIQQNHRRKQIATPFDSEIAKLSNDLNATYIGYGRQGSAKMKRQRAQDSNASSMGAGVAAKRAKSKGGRSYKNSAWDLVDLAGEKDGDKRLESMDESSLPAEMKKMDKSERRAFVQKKAGARKGIQAKIRKLSDKRDKFITAARTRKSRKQTSTFERAVIKTIDTQMQSKGYVFE